MKDKNNQVGQALISKVRSFQWFSKFLKLEIWFASTFKDHIRTVQIQPDR